MSANDKWEWLSDSKNQKTLAWLGAAIIAIISAGWSGYQAVTTTPAPLLTEAAAPASHSAPPQSDTPLSSGSSNSSS